MRIMKWQSRITYNDIVAIFVIEYGTHFIEFDTNKLTLKQ